MTASSENGLRLSFLWISRMLGVTCDNTNASTGWALVSLILLSKPCLRAVLGDNSSADNGALRTFHFDVQVHPMHNAILQMPRMIRRVMRYGSDTVGLKMQELTALDKPYTMLLKKPLACCTRPRLKLWMVPHAPNRMLGECSITAKVITQ